MLRLNIVAFVLLLLMACGPKETEWAKLTGKAQGTTFTIKYLDTLGRDLSQPVDSLFRVIDRSLSLWDSSSTVTRFNAAADSFTTDDRHFQVVLALARQQWIATDGAFDPTVLPLVRAWGLGKEGRMALDTTAADSLLRCVGMPRIRIPDSWERDANAASSKAICSRARATTVSLWAEGNVSSPRCNSRASSLVMGKIPMQHWQQPWLHGMRQGVRLGRAETSSRLVGTRAAGAERTHRSP